MRETSTESPRCSSTRPGAARPGPACGGVRSRSCYFTVLQAVPGLTLQPILAGQYHDEFERVDGDWRFTDRVILPDLIGDLSHHMRPPDPTPAD